MPTILVIWIARLAAWLTRTFAGGDASSLPGLVAERLQPRILQQLGRHLHGKVVLVTGTNGKTTTTRMIAAAIDSPETLVNRAGSNLTRGLTSTLIADSNWRGRLNSKQAVFEVDEAAFAAAFSALNPGTVVILNLFRDQLDRYGELNTLAAKLADAIKGTKVRVVLNADDPLVAWLGQGLVNVSYFGIREASVTKLAHDFAADSISCPVCAAPLKYSSIWYAHIGDYECERKNFARPALNVVGTTTKISLDNSTSEVKIGSNKVSLKLNLPGLYNAYNALAAIAVADGLKVGLVDAAQRIQTMPPAYGRAEVIKVDDKQLQLFLVKNPTGFNQVIQAYLQGKQQQPMLVVINDLIADGRDVSWLWDVAFEDLSDDQVITSSGTRAHDLALRLKYAGLDTTTEANIQAAVTEFLASVPAGETGIVLPTYTAMRQVREVLSKLTTIVGVHE